MCLYEQDETETHQYRRLWLDAEHELGMVAELLADATGWQPSDTQPMPDALELAERAAMRLAQLEQAVDVYQPRLRGRREREYA